jgi:hypothetical protein
VRFGFSTRLSGVAELIAKPVVTLAARATSITIAPLRAWRALAVALDDEGRDTRRSCSRD